MSLFILMPLCTDIFQNGWAYWHLAVTAQAVLYESDQSTVIT